MGENSATKRPYNVESRSAGFYEIGGHVIPKIDGNISRSKNKEIFMAYTSFGDQRQRCYNKNSKAYRLYGGRGIEVEYCSRQFVSWWVYWQNKLQLKKPTTGRVDHNKNYCFENIVLEEHSVNCSESVRKQGILSAKPVVVRHYESDEYLMIFKSITECAVFLKCSRMPIESRLTGRRPKQSQNYNGFSFKYV